MLPSHLEAAISEAWDFGNPRASMEDFAARTQTEESESSRQIWRTQMARALGLQGDYEGAKEILAKVRAAIDQLPHGPDRHHLSARWEIEYGRVLNSEGEPAAARPYFERAHQEAVAAVAEGLAIDALHMIAIVEGKLGGPSWSRVWNEQALSQAQASRDPDARRWQASLLNNLGWNFHEAGDYEGALDRFEQAARLRRQSGTPVAIEQAEWAVGRALRSLGRFDEALAVQLGLASQPPGADDGYVYQEIGENLRALGRVEQAESALARARELLGPEPTAG
ncbi:MAG TPA: tetratricopeptide repeat protein [Acidimicrobiia bacterium]|nr:tetratricopeptide repeat protein [Acidimicrobiia bacterium]